VVVYNSNKTNATEAPAPELTEEKDSGNDLHQSVNTALTIITPMFFLTAITTLTFVSVLAAPSTVEPLQPFYTSLLFCCAKGWKMALKPWVFLGLQKP